MKNYPHNVIRIRKSKPNFSQVYRFIKILNKKHQKSQKVTDQVGFYRFGKYPILNINGKNLANNLNKGVILKKSVKQYLLLSTLYRKSNSRKFKIN